MYTLVEYSPRELSGVHRNVFSTLHAKLSHPLPPPLHLTLDSIPASTISLIWYRLSPTCSSSANDVIISLRNEADPSFTRSSFPNVVVDFGQNNIVLSNYVDPIQFSASVRKSKIQFRRLGSFGIVLISCQSGLDASLQRASMHYNALYGQASPRLLFGIAVEIWHRNNVYGTVN